MYRYPSGRKAHVRKSTCFGQPCWVAGKPGGVYPLGEGWHFRDWADAIEYATTPSDQSREKVRR